MDGDRAVSEQLDAPIRKGHEADHPGAMSARLLDEADRSQHRTAACDNVIDDDDAIPVCDRLALDRLGFARRIGHLVRLDEGLTWQLPGPTRETHPTTENVRDRGAKNATPRLDAQDAVGRNLLAELGHR